MSQIFDYKQWQNLYSRTDSNWQDLTRIGQVVVPIVILIFLPTIYVVAGYLTTHLESWGPNSLSTLQKLIFFLRLFFTVLAPTLVTLIGLILIFKSTINYLRTINTLPPNQKIGPIIRRRLLGVPPTPPPLNRIIKYPFIVLKEPILEDNHWVRLIGGPATLVVYDGVAVYLERGNRFSRVVGPGMPFLDRYERVKEVIDLKPQRKTGYVMPWTKDGIRIKLAIMAECQINTSHQARQESKNLQYCYDPLAVKKAVESITVKEDGEGLRQAYWLEGAWGSITGAINAYVARHSLDELFLAPLAPITNPAAYSGMIAQLLSEAFSAAMLGQINSALARNGCKALNIQITQVELPEAVLALRIKHWESEKKILSARKISKAEADSFRMHEMAFAVAQRNMLETITQKLEKLAPENLTQPLILSLSGLLDQGLNDPIVRPLLAKESFAALERLKKLLDQEF